jgi:2-hydroxychromene-2-carboxylate isomerase
MNRLPADVTVRYRPVLFAGLLNQWGHKGPAEIPGKRIYTFRQAHWLAKRAGIPYRMPPNHPFNPLRALRLAIALGSEREPIANIFRAIWSDGLLPDDPVGWRGIVDAVARGNADALIGDHKVKDELHENGTRAISAGVFGVPTFMVDGALFWGQDATDFLLDYLDNPDLLDDPEIKRIDTVRPSAVRPGN